jgi:hypothetical protein
MPASDRHPYPIWVMAGQSDTDYIEAGKMYEAFTSHRDPNHATHATITDEDGDVITITLHTGCRHLSPYHNAFAWTIAMVREPDVRRNLHRRKARKINLAD